MLCLRRGGKPEYQPGEKPLGARTRTNNTLYPNITPSRGIEPRPQWWEASALITAPSLQASSVVFGNCKFTR